MTNAGWYPDPAGQPQTYRYWDGRSWSDQTTSNPYDPPPAPAPPAFGQEPTIVGGTPPPPPGGPATPYGGGAPPPPAPPAPPGGYGGQGGYGQHPPAPPGGSGGSGGSGKVVLLAVVGVVLLALIGVGGFFGVRALTDDDGGDSTDGASESVTDGTTDGTGTTDDGTEGGTEGGSETSSPESTEGITPSTLQCSGGNPGAPSNVPADGQLHGGGLTVPNPKGYTPDDATGAAFAFADSVQTSIRQIEEFWVSLYAVGGLRRANDFESPQQAAELLVQCMTGSEDFYTGFTGRSDIRNGPVTVDGQSGHEVYTEVRVDDDRIQAEGDVLHVIVVDTGNEEQYGLYISMTPIGDQKLIDRQEQTAQQITVD